jgi:hypothetical protein
LPLGNYTFEAHETREFTRTKTQRHRPRPYDSKRATSRRLGGELLRTFVLIRACLAEAWRGGRFAGKLSFTLRRTAFALPAMRSACNVPSQLLVRARSDVRVAGISDPGYAFTIRLITHHGRWRGSGCCRGAGWRGGGEPLSQLGAHKLPSLYSPRIPAVGDTSRGRRYPSPIGGITRSPIKASASANVCWIQLPSAPLAMFSFAAISCFARMSKPFPRTGSRRIASN